MGFLFYKKLDFCESFKGDGVPPLLNNYLFIEFISSIYKLDFYESYLKLELNISLDYLEILFFLY